jgi:hypothetical protein
MHTGASGSIPDPRGDWISSGGGFRIRPCACACAASAVLIVSSSTRTSISP